MNESAHSSISRRQALRITAVAGLSVAFGGTLTRAILRRAGMHRVEATRFGLGTPVTIGVTHTSEDGARTMVEAAFEELGRLEGILSRHRADTPVALLARMGVVRRPPEELVEVLQRAHEISELSGGAFDVTVAPLLRLYQERSTLPGAPLPSDGEVSRALELVDYRRIRVDGDAIALETPGMAITLDGIAKGYVVDRVVQTLVERGADHVVVEAGGDLASGGEGAEKDGWPVAIQDPRNPAGTVGDFQLRGEGVATSGDYVQAFTGDRTLHHILDPRTGQSPIHTSGATVIARNAMEADALSTAAFVLGPEEGVAFLARLPGVEGLLVTKDGRPSRTPGFPA
ncbi:MAG: FAD:protein FMN transferase [Gemmatimonadota bacterium]